MTPTVATVGELATRYHVAHSTVWRALTLSAIRPDAPNPPTPIHSTYPRLYNIQQSDEWWTKWLKARRKRGRPRKNPH